MVKSNVAYFIESVKNDVNGLHATTVVEIDSGMTPESYSDGSLDPDVASAYNVEIVKSKLKAIKALGLDQTIDDILISLTSQYHLINCTNNGTHMIFLAADSGKANIEILRNVVKKGKEITQTDL